MKNLKKTSWLLLSIISGCTNLSYRPIERSISSLEASPTISLDIKLKQTKVFANGANGAKLVIRPELGMQEYDFSILSNVLLIESDFKKHDGIIETYIIPPAESTKVKFYVLYKGKIISDLMFLETTVEPFKDRLQPFYHDSQKGDQIDDLHYFGGSQLPEKTYEGFIFSNSGENKIVTSALELRTKRSFLFKYPEFARQNIIFRLEDEPNGYGTHRLLSTFVLFPRKQLPIAVVRENGLDVTLPTGEKVIFDKKTFEIIGGVLSEGPVDNRQITREKRNYADIIYHGEGVILRANARAEIPELGQFETDKIDMNTGRVGSVGVLIIDGKTGAKCHRPKKDFWEPIDREPIEFKFPTDEEFNKYLKAHCGFEISAVTEIPSSKPTEESILTKAKNIWMNCKQTLSGKVETAKEDEPFHMLEADYLDSAIRSCVSESLGEKDNELIFSHLSFEIYELYLKDRKKEESDLTAQLPSEAQKVKDLVASDLGWVSAYEDLRKLNSECLVQAQKNISFPYRFINLSKEIKNNISNQVCERFPQSEAFRQLVSKYESDISQEIQRIKPHVLSDVSWITDFMSQSRIQADCNLFALKLAGEHFKGSKLEGAFQRKVKEEICSTVESSPAYKDFLKKLTVELAEKARRDVFNLLEKSLEAAALICLEDYPMNNSFNRIRWKTQRVRCLDDKWAYLEEKALSTVFNEPRVRKVQVSADEIKALLEQERPSMLLDAMEKIYH